MIDLHYYTDFTFTNLVLVLIMLVDISNSEDGSLYIIENLDIYHQNCITSYKYHF